jgi:hypothetical protein
MARLRAREQQGRSLRVLIDPIDQSVVDSYSYAAMNHCYVTYTKRLIQKLQDMRQRLQERPEWPHKDRPITDEELQYASNRVSPHAVAQLSLANPWPTREMSGIEVLVEDTFPFDQKKFLPVPEPAKKQFARQQSMLIHQHFLSLWIVDEPMNENIKKLVDVIRRLPNFAQPTLAQPLPTINKLNNLQNEASAQLVIVHTIDGAKEWIVVNRELIRKPGTFFKVVIVWSLSDQMRAVDAIRAVRTEEAHAPVLIFTNNREEIRPALEFPNVTVTDTLFDLYEFIGANQETQWNAGYRVSHSVLHMLFWIDSDQNDLQTTEQLRQIYPQLEIQFAPTFSEARAYLEKNLRGIRHRQQLMVICRGHYAEESKNVIDVVRLLDEFNPSIPIGLYTRNRVSLNQHIPNIPERIQVFEEREELFTFVLDNLIQ